jgi:hypothetical protein
MMKPGAHRRSSGAVLGISALMGAWASFSVINYPASATAVCNTGDTLGYVLLNGSMVWAEGVYLECGSITGGDYVRGVLDCRWAPDPKTGWAWSAPAYLESNKYCVTGNRGTRADIG